MVMRMIMLIMMIMMMMMMRSKTSKTSKMNCIKLRFGGRVNVRIRVRSGRG
jgi:hypothetical protein